MEDDLEHLSNPLRALRRTGAEFGWRDADRLRLNDRYRERQLPLLNEQSRRREELAESPLRAGEFWPPVRCAVLPLDDAAIQADPVFAQFLADLRGSAAADAIWWRGLRLREDRIHCNLHAEVGDARWDDELGPGPRLVVRGPWIGRLNNGRIYLPVQVAGEQDQRAFWRVREQVRAPHVPMLAGYFQLTGDLSGDAYRDLRDLVLDYQERIAVPMQADRVWIMDTMDSLVLRSRIHETIRFSGQ